ncbi:hypothetical protein, partial [Vibrio injensis]|uniref:hypothetical protein n=1 Tax=Vibrio injensis TaxID=1307414 RepID=UPI00278C6701
MADKPKSQITQSDFEKKKLNTNRFKTKMRQPLKLTASIHFKQRQHYSITDKQDRIAEGTEKRPQPIDFMRLSIT